MPTGSTPARAGRPTTPPKLPLPRRGQQQRRRAAVGNRVGVLDRADVLPGPAGSGRHRPGWLRCTSGRWAAAAAAVRMPLLQRAEPEVTIRSSRVWSASRYSSMRSPANSMELSRAKEHSVRMRKQVEEHIREARHSDLEPSARRRRRDLGTALRAFAEQAAAAVAVDVGITGAPPRRPLRIGQEAITNAVRHSGASRIDVRLDYGTKDVVLSVATGAGSISARSQSQPNGRVRADHDEGARGRGIGGTLSHQAARAGRHPGCVVHTSRTGRACLVRRITVLCINK